MLSTAALTKLASSGLDVTDAEALGFQALSVEEVKALNPKYRDLPALYIPYYTPDGEIMRDIPSAPPYYRLRYLPKDKKSFADLAIDKNKYEQPHGSVPCVYFAKNHPDWLKTLRDTRAPLIITEGELKAAKGCKEGYNVIGLGGVDSWRARKVGVEILQDLAAIPLSRRNVYICYDSDYLTNSNVLRAMNSLTSALEALGAYVSVVTLPTIPGVKKCGLDDFFYYTVCAKAEFDNLLASSQPVGFSRALHALNDKYLILSDPAAVLDKRLNTIYRPDIFKSVVESSKTHTIRVPIKADSATGGPEYKFITTSAAKEWLTWPLAERAHTLAYKPGRPRELLIDKNGYAVTAYNLWGGWGATPVKGDVSLFIDFINYIFSTAHTEASKDWFMKWLAYPIQHPGAKLLTACVFHGTTQGVGKTLLGYTMKPIYGRNACEIRQSDITSEFNASIVNKQFIIADEITGSSQRKFGDLIKSLITSETFTVNEKYRPQYELDNCVNYFFTSNHPDAFFIEDTDRRLFIHEVPSARQSDDYYKSYERFYKSEKGANAIMYYLLNDVDTSDFNPSSPAPVTDAKLRMTELGLSDLGLWIRNLTTHPDVYLNYTNRDIFSARELLLIYDPLDKKRVTSNGVARELSRVNIPRANSGNKIKLSQIEVSNYYILRNVQKWLNAEHGVCVDHIRATSAYPGGGITHG